VESKAFRILRQMAKRKINTKKLIDKIEKVTRERIANNSVVSLEEFRNLKKKKEPQTILVIDDDETMRAALKRIFETDGYRVITASDGTQLAGVLDDNPIELIILDIGLPWINGFELAQMMKEHDDLKKIPLIFISARRADSDVRRGFEVGADDYIKKPFDIEQIRKTVSTLMRLAK
jgi:two-component system, OmpR family, aerobic respiration control protein ArcA